MIKLSIVERLRVSNWIILGGWASSALLTRW